MVGTNSPVWCRSPSFGNGAIDPLTKTSKTTRRTTECHEVCRNVVHRECDSEAPVCRPGERPCPRRRCYDVTERQCGERCTQASCSADERNLKQDCQLPLCWVDPVVSDPASAACEVTRWTAKYARGKETSAGECMDRTKATDIETGDPIPIYGVCRKDPSAGMAPLHECPITDVTVQFSPADKSLSLAELSRLEPRLQYKIPAPNNTQMPSCTTCDDVAVEDSDTAVAAKLACLTRTLPPSAPLVIERRRHALLKLLLERRAHRLTEPQRASILSLYAQFRDDRPACGHTWSKPGSDSDEIAAAIELCDRVATSHEPGPIQSRSAEALAPLCIETISRARSLADATPSKRIYLQDSTRAAAGVLVSAFASLPDEDSARRRAVLQRRLALLARWYAAASSGDLDPEGMRALWQTAESINAALWSGLHAAVLGRLESAVKARGSAAALSEHLGEAEAVDREILDAMFGLGVAEPPMLSSLHLAIFAQAVERLDRRLQQFASYHDMACRVLDCSARKTKLALATRVLAAVSDAGLLAQELTLARELAATGSIAFNDEWTSWRRTFELIQARHGALERAVLEAAGLPVTKPYCPDLALRITDGAPPSLRLLAATLRGARARADRYASTGQFLATPGGEEIIFGLRQNNQVAIIEAVRAASNQLARAREAYQLERNAMLNARLTEARSASAAISGTQRAGQLIDEMTAIVSDIRGLGVTAEQDIARFSDFATSYVEAMHAAVGEAPAMRIEAQISPFAIRAAEARYTGGEPNTLDSAHLDPRSATPWRIASGEAGDLVNLSVTGTWSPTCAMRAMASSGPFDLRKAAETAPETSSEGYSSQFTASGFTAKSERSAWETSDSSSTSFCLGGPTSVSFFFVSSQVNSLQHCWNWSEGSSKTTDDTQGSESRTSASFTNGLRLPNTPFPDYPVGSLLAVLARPRALAPEIIDVQVILPDRFTVAFREAADLYVVVNDRSCTSSRGQLTIQGVHMKPTDTKLRQLGEAMGAAVKTVRDQGHTLASQGRLLPSQTAQLRALAWQTLRTLCRCDPESYPASVRGYYSLWIEIEVARVERQVEVIALQRRLQQITAELDSIARQVASEQAQARIGSRLAALALSSLDIDALRGESLALVRLVQTQLAPFVALRYPEAISGPDGVLQIAEDRRKLEKLTELDWTEPVDSYVEDVRRAVDTVVTHLSAAALKAPPPSVTTAVIGFRNPYVPAPPSGPLPSPWRWIDDARARDIWDAIRAGRRVFIELRPEDLYGRDVVSIDCNNVTPVIAAMALYVERPQDTVNDSLNSGKWTTRMRAETRMVFPVVDGQRVMRFANADWLRKPVRFLYGSELQALDVFHRIGQAERTSQGLSPYDGSMVGISPFTRFVIEPIRLKSGDGKEINLANPIRSSPGSGDATALMLILELEARIDSREIKGVITCLPQD